MTEDEARADIGLLTRSTSAPTLDGEELEYLLRRAKRADSSGRAPSDAAWEPTFNIAFAVGLGWELKAGKLVDAYDFKSKDRSFNRSQMRKHCLDQMKLWKSRATESVMLPGAWRKRVIQTQTNGYLDEDLPYLDDL